MKSMQSGFAGTWERLIAVQARDEEEARLGRLFNTLMVISTGIVFALSIDFLFLHPLGFTSASVSWIAAAFPLAFIPLSIFCLIQARRGHTRPMVLLYVWVNLIAIGVAVWLFDGVYSPAWQLFIWTITVAGVLLAPAYSLRMTVGVASYFVLLIIATRSGWYTPPLTFGQAGREFVHMSALLIMLVSTVGLLTYLNMRSLREALENLRNEIAVRKRTEEYLRQSEERFRSIFEHVDDIIYTVEADGTFSSISPSCERMLGWQPGEWVGRPFPPIVHPDDLPHMQELFAKAQAGEALPVFQVRILTKTGGYLESEIAATPIRRDGTIVTIGVVRDITERKRAAQAIEESERKFRSIFDTAPDGIFTTSMDGVLTSVNPAVEHFVGWSSTELVGTPYAAWIHPEDLGQINTAFLNVISGQSVEVEARIRAKTGGYRVLDFTATPLIEHGNVAGTLGFFRDITERKRMEEEIRKLNEELEEKVSERTRQLLEAQDELVRKEKLAVLGQVVGRVGHELRNPLGVMNNAVYFLQTVLADADNSVKEYLNIIKNEIAGSERIVSELLDSVRTKPPRPEIAGVRELIKQTLDKLNIPSSVTVKLDIPETLPPLRVDPQQIQQVLRNLISNGMEAMTAGGTLEIGASVNASTGNITINVRDSGSGMTPEQLGKLFQPLFTTKARGIGLGLLVVKNLTEVNGGTVEVKSEAGKGSVFTVTLPSGS